MMRASLLPILSATPPKTMPAALCTMPEIPSRTDAVAGVIPRSVKCGTRCTFMVKVQ